MSRQSMSRIYVPEMCSEDGKTGRAYVARVGKMPQKDRVYAQGVPQGRYQGPRQRTMAISCKAANGKQVGNAEGL